VVIPTIFAVVPSGKVNVILEIGKPSDSEQDRVWDRRGKQGGKLRALAKQRSVTVDEATMMGKYSKLRWECTGPDAGLMCRNIH
jgi:hypothetical protein